MSNLKKLRYSIMHRRFKVWKSFLLLETVLFITTLAY